MIVDALNRLSDAQAITTTANSTFSLDLKSGRDIGEGEELFVVFNVGTAFAGGTSVQISIVTADDAGLTSNVTTLASLPAIATANLTAGARRVLQIPPQFGTNGRQYLGVVYTVVGTFSAGTITADIEPEGSWNNHHYYASGFTVQG
jgi:predicted RecA/RadA family phage recombinase